jgi:hypothetical protein
MKMESFVVDKSLSGLSYALRHPETWPPGFEFDYIHDKTCAMGLAYRVGMIDEPHAEAMMRAFGIRRHCDAFTMFCSGYGCTRKSEITADMVADRIDAYLARSARC